MTQKVNIRDMLRSRREEILHIAEKHGAGNVRIFGSVVRGEATDESDIDFLIDIVGPTPPWFPGGLVADLEDLLGHRIDVVTEDSIYCLLRPRILKEAEPL